MKNFIQIPLFLLTISPSLTMAEDFVIETEELAPLPQSVEAAIRNSKGFESTSCKLIGKTISLSGKGADSGFVATTAEGCDWGAALGPIWVVRNGTQPVMVLAAGGYTLTLGKQSQNGLRNITIAAATAGWSSESLWKFDGVRYVKVKEKSGANR